MKKLIWLAVLMTACVSSSKYQDALDRLKQCQADKDACTAESTDQKKKIDDLNKQLADTSAERDKLKAADAADQKSLADLQANMNTTKKELDELRKQREEAEKRLAKFKELTAKFQAMISAGKLQVLFRNGKMIVKLPSGVLFKSGEASLSKDGESALADVASILKTFPDRHFLITGHTDNVPLPRHGEFKDNWELSTARAVTVTEFLVKQGMDPKALAAAGYGEFDPVGDNATPDGQAQNRRIEIVLEPNIEELPALPEGT